MIEIDSLEELKSIELEIMKKIHMFCESNGIRYYLAYGTLIGAVRHKGFIPWDDDIDIFMPRPDYERFINEFQFFASQNNLNIASNKTKPYMCRAFAKICDSRTIQFEPKYKDKEPRGVFVDVWPLDGYPKTWIGRKLHQCILTVEFIILYASLTKIEYIPQKNKLKRLLIRIFRNTDSEKLLKKFEKNTKKYSFDDSDWVMCSSAKPQMFKKEWFKDRILLNFEDAKFYAPVGYDEYLRCRYGDYLKLPPKEEQNPHHVINTYWKEDTDENPN